MAERKLKRFNNGPVIQEEKETVKKMIEIYCRRKHGHKKSLCEDCEDLLQYAHKRLSLCRFGEEKTACANCKVQCYKPFYKEKIQKVMRYSGPWMLLYRPFYSIKHIPKKNR